MKNTLADLNNHLFIQLERVNSEDLSGDKLNEEIKRSDAVTNLAGTIIDNAALSLKAALAVANSLAEIQMPSMLESPPKPGKTTSIKPGMKQLEQ